MNRSFLVVGIVVVIAVVVLLIVGPWRRGSVPEDTRTGGEVVEPGGAPGGGGVPDEPGVEPGEGTERVPSGETDEPTARGARDVIAGRVVDARGEPVAEAEVAVLMSRHLEGREEDGVVTPRRREDMFERLLKTNAEGEFEVTGVPTVETVTSVEAASRSEVITCILVVQKEGYQMEWLDVRPGDCELRIVLQETVAVVSGRVIAKESRQPLEEARIVCRSAETTSDADGRFRLKVPVELKPPEGMKLSVICYPREPYYAPKEVRDVQLVQGEEVEELLFDLEHGSAAIQGEIFDAQTRQLTAGMRARLYEYDRYQYYYFPDKTRLEMTADASDGTFVFENLRPGMYQVEAIKDAWNCVLGRYRVTVEAKAEPHDVKIYVSTTGARFITGTITGPGGGPVEHAAVWFLDGERVVTYGAASSDAKGRYGLPFPLRLSGKSPKVMVLHADYELATVPVTIGREDPVRVDVALNKGTQLVGKVADGGGTPVKDATILVDGEPLGPTMPTGFSYLPNPRATVTTGDDGTFGFVHLPPGEYVIAADHSDFVFAEQTVTIVQGTEQRCDFVLDKGLVIEGTVYDEKGTPLRVRSVVAVGRDDREHDAVVSGADGRFTLRTLPRDQQVSVLVLADQVDLRRDDNFYYAKVEGVEPGRKDLRIDAKLMGLGTVELEVVEAGSGKPVTRYQVWCSWQPRTGLSGLARRYISRPSYGRASVQDERGRATLGRLFPGTHRFTVNAEGLTSATANPIEVTSGGTATVRVELQRSTGN